MIRWQKPRPLPAWRRGLSDLAVETAVSAVAFLLAVLIAGALLNFGASL